MNPVFALKQNCKWWTTGKVDSEHLHSRIRPEFSEIIKNLSNNKIIDLCGPTGVGKSSLLLDTVNYLLNNSISPERIVLFSGDDMTLFGEHRSVGSLIETYSNDVVHENLFEFSKPVYILIDDIQFIDDWQIYITNYQKKAQNIHFVITQVPRLNENTTDDIFYHINVMPLTQSQFTDFFCANKEIDFDLVRYKSLLPENILFDDIEAYYQTLSQNIYPLNQYRPYKTEIIESYLLNGGYPAYFSFNSVSDFQKYLCSTIDISLYRDVAALTGLKAPQKLKRLLYIIADHGTTEQSYGSIGRSIYVDTSTVIAYINAIEKGGYAGVAENYSLQSTAEGKVIRKNKQLYVFDVGIRNATLSITDITQAYQESVSRALMYTARKHADKNGSNVFFWEDNKRYVDIILADKNSALPIIINFDRQQMDKRVKGLKAFMRAFSCDKALVVTQDILKRQDNLYFIPYWMI